MPLYDYECENCSHLLFDVKQSFNDDPLSSCPECKEPKLNRVISGGIYTFSKGPNTIGQQADRNTSQNRSQIQEIEHKKRESQPREEKAWYHKDENVSPKEIRSMTNKQKTKYIMEGKK